MTLKKPILKFILSISMFIACTEQSNVSTYLNNHHLENKYHSIIVLTEKGCPNCNSNLANTITDIAFDSTLLVVNALGTVIDLTDIRKNDLKNDLIYDYKEDYKELGLSGSGVILIDENLEIDSIIRLDASELLQQLNFIQTLSQD